MNDNNDCQAVHDKLQMYQTSVRALVADGRFEVYVDKPSASVVR